MLSVVVATLIVFTVTASGNCTPSELTKNELEHRMDTKTLIDMLAKLMDVIDGSQGKTIPHSDMLSFMKPPPPPFSDKAVTSSTCTSWTLGTQELNVLLNSLMSDSSQAYLIYTFSGGLRVYSASLQSEELIYDCLRNEVAARGVLPPTDIWVNKVPCPRCTTELSLALPPDYTTIHVESFLFNETNLENIMEQFGCLARLDSRTTLEPWDWDTFMSQFNLINPTYTSIINSATTEETYILKKSVFNRLFSMIKQLEDNNNIKDWCT